MTNLSKVAKLNSVYIFMIVNLVVALVTLLPNTLTFYWSIPQSLPCKPKFVNGAVGLFCNHAYFFGLIWGTFDEKMNRQLNETHKEKLK